MPRRSLMIVVGILAVALLLRVVVVVAQPNWAPYSDALDYDRHAKSIAAGEGYPDTQLAEPGTATALRPPAYPFWLGGSYAITGNSRGVARLLGAGLGVLTVALIFLVARRVWGERVAMVAAALAAISPPLVFTNASLVSEQLFLPMMLGVVLLVLRAREAGEMPSVRYAAAAGALCGLCALTRVIGLVLLAAVFLGLWTGRPRISRRALAAPAVAALTAVIVLAPWVIRNNIVFETPVPLATQEGFNLFGTYNEASADRNPPANFILPTTLPASRGLFRRPGWDEARISSELGERGRTYALENPGYVLKVAFWNTKRMLGIADQPLADSDYLQTGVPVGWRSILESSVTIMFIGAAMGAILLVARVFSRGPGFMWLIPLLLYLSLAVFLAAPRYRLPIDPFLLMLCAVAVVWTTERLIAFRERRRPQPAES